MGRQSKMHCLARYWGECGKKQMTSAVLNSGQRHVDSFDSWWRGKLVTSDSWDNELVENFTLTLRHKGFSIQTGLDLMKLMLRFH